MAIQNPSVREYLLKRKQERDALEGQIKDDSSGPNWGAGLAAIAAGLQGKDSVAAGQGVLDAQEKSAQNKISNFDKGTESFLRDTEAVNAADKLDREKAILTAEDDVNSEESKMATELAKRMGYKGGPVSATKFKTFSPSLQKMYEIEQKKLDRAETREQRSHERQVKRDEKMQGLKTPFGLANTEDDAKKLKEAFEAKQNFDSKLQEMIELRKKYGTEYFNREQVARGQQLSKDLLLEYKNMAKLGVLSQADESIINAIIPSDPLGQDWAPGQDPILSNLTKFKGDNDRDFQTRVATRTRAGVEGAARPRKEVLKTQTNQKTGEKRIVYTDGTTEIIPSNTAGL